MAIDDSTSNDNDKDRQNSVQVQYLEKEQMSRADLNKQLSKTPNKKIASKFKKAARRALQQSQADEKANSLRLQEAQGLQQQNNQLAIPHQYNSNLNYTENQLSVGLMNSTGNGAVHNAQSHIMNSENDGVISLD